MSAVVPTYISTLALGAAKNAHQGRARRRTYGYKVEYQRNGQAELDQTKVAFVVLIPIVAGVTRWRPEMDEKKTRTTVILRLMPTPRSRLS